MSARFMHIGALLSHVGIHPAAWLEPGVPLGGEVDLANWIGMAKTAEQAKLDFIFRADSPASREGDLEAITRFPGHIAELEPLTIMSALAAVTKNIGLASTISTSFYEPYNVARLYASLDHISGGRAAWNVVTTSASIAAKNFGKTGLEDHAQRYARANEFVDVVTGLWDSWDEDAFIRNRASGRFFDPSKRHVLDYKGEFYSVRGPLDVPRSPQGRPVIVNAGGSEAGMELAARTAEVVFSVDRSLEKAKAFYANLKGRMAKYGRRPEALKIVCALNPYVGETDAQGQEKLDYLQSMIHPAVGREIISVDLGGIDLHNLPLDEPIPESALPTASNATKSYFDNMVAAIREDKLTVRQLYLACAASRGGMNAIAGSGATIADRMEQWFKEGAADGFMVRVSHLPGGLEDFTKYVIPELQERKLFRTEYSGPTLRDQLGLARPQSRYRPTSS
ncbi:MAG TPA: LLM class flavin-dependent oxidoreductase [Bordetella sp.]